MTRPAYRIALAGTFDVQNYGDLLFPWLAQAELADRLEQVEVEPYSYRAKSAADWPYAVRSLTELPGRASGLDALLVGGGHLVRFDQDVAPGYAPPAATIHHPTGFWLSPALIALQHGVPLVWNAPGADFEAGVPAWALPLLELALAGSAYIALRDAPSRDLLAGLAGGNPIAVVPDTAFGIDRLLPQRPSADLERLRERSGLKRPYILIQSVSGLYDCYRFFVRYADHFRDYQFLELPIGPENGDGERRGYPELPGVVRLGEWPRPRVVAELIRDASAVVGHSFHLATTAVATGVPAYTDALSGAGKYVGLAAFESLRPLPGENETDPADFLGQLGRRPVSGAALAARDLVAAHWDRVAATVRAGRTGSAEIVGRFWQRLPAVLEEGGARAEGALAALAAQSRALARLESESPAAERRIAELSRLVDLARDEIVRRDGRIQELLESTSWRVAAPVRFAGRLLRRGTPFKEERR